MTPSAICVHLCHAWVSTWVLYRQEGSDAEVMVNRRMCGMEAVLILAKLPAVLLWNSLISVPEHHVATVLFDQRLDSAARLSDSNADFETRH